MHGCMVWHGRSGMDGLCLDEKTNSMKNKMFLDYYCWLFF